ncbi:UNVERIFIED_CONTAM: DNA topoisomerase 1 [Siphonaria sp. JEL0065]|nr:DNA topoisomerase 1 [Siphonaria sp. JEL0065]
MSRRALSTKPSLKEESDSDSNQHSEEESDDAFASDGSLAKTAKTKASKKITPSTSTSKKSKAEISDESSDDDNTPIASAKKRPSSASADKSAEKNKKSKKEEDSDVNDSDDDDDEPIAKKKKAAPVKKAPAVKIKKESAASKRKSAATSDDDDGDADSDIAPPAKKKKASSTTAVAVKASPSAKKAAVKGAVKKEGKNVKKEDGAEGEGEEEEGEEEYAWWINGLGDGAEKWKTMEHNGVVFPPPYMPHGIKMKYDGTPIELEPDSEEVATFFAGVVGTDYEKNKTFVANFFRDFQTVLAREKKKTPIKEFSKCDFTPIVNHLNELKEQRKSKTKEEKLAAKKEKEELEEKYGWAIFDGRKEKVGNFRIEPPGLFRGRGDHPKTGTLKLRVTPEQVTINIGKEAKIPDPPAGHKWGGVVHDNTVAWLATWKENVNDNIKYVLMAATSSLKGQSDLKKFEKARELKKHIHKIRRDYTEGLKDKLMATRQLSTALYFIDRLALRAGNEKGEDEADTVGCCSLRFEHVTLEPPNKVIFDFLGKDSIRYYNQVEVDEQVFKNIKIFKRDPKKEGDMLFDRLNTGILNKDLTRHMPGLSAKVFRTFNASYTFQKELNDHTPVDGTVAEKILAYNRANRQVAILCNHQRAVSKGHSAAMEKIQDKVLGMKYERRLIKKALLEVDPKLKKKRPELTQDESDVDDEFIARYHTMQEEKEALARQKALEKENEKRKAEGEPPLKTLDAKKKASVALESLSVEKLEKKLEDMTKRIENIKLQMIDKDENKTTALGTSKINYIDPRISVAWCKKFDVDLDKIFNRSLRDKFKWATHLEEDWEF